MNFTSYKSISGKRKEKKRKEKETDDRVPHAILSKTEDGGAATLR